MIGVLLLVDGAVLFALVTVTAVVGRANAVSGWRYTLVGGVLAALAAAGTWMFDLPTWAYVVAGFVVATAVFLGLGADVIRLSKLRRPVPLGVTIEASLRGLVNPGADLERLADLRDRGVLTDAEFTEQKRRLLNRR